MRISDWSSDVCASDLLRPFERLLIETTGLADPAPILHTLMADPVVGSHYRLDGVVTTVDAVNGDSTLDNHEESVRQAAMADRLRSEEHTSELQSLMRISYAVFCLKKKKRPLTRKQNITYKLNS